MSGGYFNYDQYRLIDIINKLDEREQDEKFDPVTEDLIEDAKVITQLAKIFLQRVDWLLSGDDDESSFKERIQKDLRDAGFSSYGTNSISFPGKKVYGFTKKIEK